MDNMQNAAVNPVKTARDLETMFRAQPVPDISYVSNGFRGWGILNKVSEAKRNSPQLGIFIAESGIAENRTFGWAALFILLAALFGFLAALKFMNSLAMIAIGFVFLAAAIYRLMMWFLNKDLKLEIFREGFRLQKASQEHVVYWRDIAYVKEQWHKSVYQGIIHVYTHKVEIVGKNGIKLEMDRSLEKIEEMGRRIQLAVADHRLPDHVEQLKRAEDCDFGAFAINRFGIRHKGSLFLPWEQVKSIDVHSIGQTTLKVNGLNQGKWSSAWATENGGAVKNLTLFLNLAYWFIESAGRPVPDSSSASQGVDSGDVYYPLLLTKRESQEGTQKVFWVGMPLQERELIVKIPPGTQPGTIYRFPDYGRTNADHGGPGTLTIEIFVEQITPQQKRWEEIQIFAGILVLIGGMIWLLMGSSLELLSNILLSTMIGGVGGILISVRQRLAGLIAGAIGGAICFILQFIYILFMYIVFARDSFWNYELVVVLLISALPGIGIYKLLQKLTRKRQMDA
jgi:hypothetical protein